MSESNPYTDAFDRDHRAPGESVLNWIVASRDGQIGAVILTDRRLCFLGPNGCRSLSVIDNELRYLPTAVGDVIAAWFETEAGAMAFDVHGEIERAHLGNLLGNIADLREARTKLEQIGVDYRYVSPAREGALEGVSAIYQLMRLKEMMNQGIFGEMDYALERTMMVQRFVEEGARQITR